MKLKLFKFNNFPPNSNFKKVKNSFLIKLNFRQTGCAYHGKMFEKMINK